MHRPTEADVPPAYRNDMHAAAAYAANTTAQMFFRMNTTAKEDEHAHTDQLSVQMSLLELLENSGWRRLRPNLRPFYSHPWSATVTLTTAVHLTVTASGWPRPLYEGKTFQRTTSDGAQEWLQRLRTFGSIEAYLLHGSGPLPPDEKLYEQLRAGGAHVIMLRTRLVER